MIKEAGEVKGNILNKKEFWEQYRFIVLKHGAPKVKAEWYMKWAQRFAHSMLRECNAEHIRHFLSNLRKQVNVEKWQIEQAVESLRILYQELLGHADVSTTMIYTHVLNKPGLAVKSPVDV